MGDISAKLDFLNATNAPVASALVSVLVAIVLRKPAVAFTSAAKHLIARMLEKHFSHRFAVVGDPARLKLPATLASMSAASLSFVVYEDAQAFAQRPRNCVAVFVSSSGHVGAASGERTRMIESVEMRDATFLCHSLFDVDMQEFERAVSRSVPKHMLITPEDIALAQERARSVFVHSLVAGHLKNVLVGVRNHPYVWMVSASVVVSLTDALRALAALLGNKYVIPEYITLIAERVMLHHVVFQNIKDRMEFLTGRPFDELKKQESRRPSRTFSRMDSSTSSLFASRPGSSASSASFDSAVDGDEAAEFLDTQLDVMFRDILGYVLGDIVPP